MNGVCMCVLACVYVWLSACVRSYCVRVCVWARLRVPSPGYRHQKVAQALETRSAEPLELKEGSGEGVQVPWGTRSGRLQIAGAA